MWAILLLGLFVGASAGPSVWPTAESKCGYDSCTKPKDGMLNVHIVPHTHDDVGWLKTVDQYYYGSRNDIQKAGVQYILDSVVKELWENPERRFIYVETAFFWKWWKLQPEGVRDKVHELVRTGRLKFVGGAWSMNDEANTYYQTTIDQFTWGLSKLNETFGECGRPTVGWQIDPFGHSREFASLLAGMGYDGLFLGRIDYQDKQFRLRDKKMEMIWRGDDTLGESSDIFTCVMYNTYSPPPGFCFDVLCQDEPIIDDPESPDYNVDRRVEEFLNYTRQMARGYRSDNVLVTMGGDFTYMLAGMWFENMDKLIQYGNLKAAKDSLNINLFYSTPDCYLKAVKDANPVLPIKQDDFFPYASDPHSFWTGYFSSRPTVKYLEAQTNSYLQMVKQLQVLAQLQDDFIPHIDELRSVMGVMQHHDAVTGTEKQHVARDYVRMVTSAVNRTRDLTNTAFNKVMKTSDRSVGVLEFDRCQFNESSCDASEKKGANLIVTVYNPLAWSYSTLVAVPVVDGDYACQDGRGNKVEVQMMDIANPILNIPYRVSKATREAYFVAKLPPLGYQSYYLTYHKASKRDKRNINTPIDINEYFDHVKHNSYNGLEVNGDLKDGYHGFVKFVPDQPEIEKYVYNIKIDDKAKNLLKSKDITDRNVEEFERIFENMFEGPKRSRNVENPYFNMGDEEMRMLADDPMVVTRYPDEEIADQTYRNDQQGEIVENRYRVCNHEYLDDCSLGVGPLFYPAVIGNNAVFENRSSGAYIFRPDSTTAIELHHENFTEIDGPIFKEFRNIYPNNVYTAFKLSKDSKINHEYDWLVGPIPIEDGIGKEFILKYDAPITTNGEYYSDSNGRQLLKRKLNKRPQWNLTLQEPVSGNYYPVTSVIKVESPDGKSLNVLTDRAVGAASLEEGSIEVMVHRRLLHDDAFGVGEALNETVGNLGLVAKGTHRVKIGDMSFKDILEMRVQRQVFVSDASNVNVKNWKKTVTEFSWVKSLPEGIHLLTIEPWGSKLLLRLENYVETTKEVDLTNILKGIKVKIAKETYLAANKWKNDSKWSWKTEEEFSDDFNKEYGNEMRPRAVRRKKEMDDGYKVKVGAKQMRTFVIEYDKVD